MCDFFEVKGEHISLNLTGYSDEPWQWTSRQQKIAG